MSNLYDGWGFVDKRSMASDRQSLLAKLDRATIALDQRDKEIERLRKLFEEILTLRSRHATDCHMVARAALKQEEKD